MTLEEFLQALTDITKQNNVCWNTIDSHIRLYCKEENLEYMYCPVTYVAATKLNKKYHVFAARTAAHELGLDLDVTTRLIAAADNYCMSVTFDTVDELGKLRKRLEDACAINIIAK